MEIGTRFEALPQALPISGSLSCKATEYGGLNHFTERNGVQWPWNSNFWGEDDPQWWEADDACSSGEEREDYYEEAHEEEDSEEDRVGSFDDDQGEDHKEDHEAGHTPGAVPAVVPGDFPGEEGLPVLSPLQYLAAVAEAPSHLAALGLVALRAGAALPKTELKRAFKQAARRVHPDKHGPAHKARAEAAFHRITFAFNELAPCAM